MVCDTIQYSKRYVSVRSTHPETHPKTRHRTLGPAQPPEPLPDSLGASQTHPQPFPLVSSPGNPGNVWREGKSLGSRGSPVGFLVLLALIPAPLLFLLTFFFL